MTKSPSKVSWWVWAKQKLDAGSFNDHILLSFEDEAQYAEFNKYNRNKYRIDHILIDPQHGRCHVWITKK